MKIQMTLRERMHKKDDGIVLGIFEKGEGTLYCCKCESLVELKDTYIKVTELPTKIVNDASRV